jgi:hypothetical protein
VLSFSSIILGTIGFAISGCLARGARWRHLALVALGVWVALSVMFLTPGTTSVFWIGGGVLTAAMMGIGGGISYIFKRG